MENIERQHTQPRAWLSHGFPVRAPRKTLSIWGHYCQAFTYPTNIESEEHRLYVIGSPHFLDAQNIRSYFDKAVDELGLEEEEGSATHAWGQ